MGQGPGKNRPTSQLESFGWKILEPDIHLPDYGSYHDFVSARRPSGVLPKMVMLSRVAVGSAAVVPATALTVGRSSFRIPAGVSIFPSGEGLSSRELEEAISGIETVSRDYPLHCAAARAFAKTHFDAAKVCAVSSMNIPYLESALILVGHGSTLNVDSSARRMPTHVPFRRSAEFSARLPAVSGKRNPPCGKSSEWWKAMWSTWCPFSSAKGISPGRSSPAELGLQGTPTRLGSREIFYCDPVGEPSESDEALLRRTRDSRSRRTPATTASFIVGHGTDLDDNSARAAKEQAARIRALGKYAPVVSSYMEEPPWIADWDKASSQSNVVIVPFFIADGLHSYQDIPVLIGIDFQPEPAVNQTDIFRRNPYELRGKKLFYASAIGTEPMMAEVILDQVAACVARNEVKGTNGQFRRPQRMTRSASSKIYFVLLPN